MNYVILLQQFIGQSKNSTQEEMVPDHVHVLPSWLQANGAAYQ